MTIVQIHLTLQALKLKTSNKNVPKTLKKNKINLYLNEFDKKLS